jgi:hypothetical protein
MEQTTMRAICPDAQVESGGAITVINIRTLVRDALDNSLVNGFDPRNARDAEYLAEDLCDLDADLNGVEPSSIIAFVQEWLVDRRSAA